MVYTNTDAYARPTYPAILTQKDWEKHKGAIAKLAVKTGIGDLMKAAKTAYDNVNWDAVELFLHRPDSRAFNLQDFNQQRRDADREVDTKVKAFSDALYELDKKASDVAKDFAKNKLIPKKSADHALEVASAARDLCNATKHTVVKQRIQEDYMGARYGYDETARNMATSLTSALNKVPAAIKELEAAQNGADFRDAMQKAARDLTQNLTNMKKLIPWGYDFGVSLNEVKDLSDRLVVWGNNYMLPKEASKEKMAEELNNFKIAVRDTLVIAKKVKTLKIPT